MPALPFKRYVIGCSCVIASSPVPYGATSSLRRGSLGFAHVVPADFCPTDPLIRTFPFAGIEAVRDRAPLPSSVKLFPLATVVVRGVVYSATLVPRAVALQFSAAAIRSMPC